MYFYSYFNREILIGFTIKILSNKNKVYYYKMCFYLDLFYEILEFKKI